MTYPTNEAKFRNNRNVYVGHHSLGIRSISVIHHGNVFRKRDCYAHIPRRKLYFPYFDSHFSCINRILSYRFLSLNRFCLFVAWLLGEAFLARQQYPIQYCHRASSIDATRGKRNALILIGSLNV